MRTKLLVSITLFSLTCFSQNLFRESFASYNSNASLAGQGSWTNNSSLPGGLGSCVGFGCVNAQVVENAVTIPGYGATSKSFSLTPNTDGCGTSFTAFTENGNLYVGMVINISNAQSSPIDFFRVLSGGNFTTTFRMLVQPTSGSTYSIGIRKGDTSNPTVYTANSYNYNTNYLLIFKYSQLAGLNDDTITLYANADYNLGEAGNTLSATTFAGNDQSGNIDRLSFRQNAGPAGMPTGIVSLVSVAKSWETLGFDLANDLFEKNHFFINGDKLSQGILSIKSDNSISGTLVIYDLQGRTIETKSVSLNSVINDVWVNPIKNKGVFIVELQSKDNRKFIQKVLVR